MRAQVRAEALPEEDLPEQDSGEDVTDLTSGLDWDKSSRDRLATNGWHANRVGR